MGDDELKALRGLRAKWRREATRRRKGLDDASAAYRERCFGEANVYESCANEVDRIIREAAGLRRARDGEGGEG